MTVNIEGWEFTTVAKERKLEFAGCVCHTHTSQDCNFTSGYKLSHFVSCRMFCPFLCLTEPTTPQNHSSTEKSKCCIWKVVIIIVTNLKIKTCILCLPGSMAFCHFVGSETAILYLGTVIFLCRIGKWRVCGRIHKTDEKRFLSLERGRRFC